MLEVFQSIRSVVNTTTTALGGSATFTGTFEQNNYSDVLVSFQGDSAGTLYFDFSVDGTNFSTFPTSGFTVASGIHEFHNAVKGPRYFRIRFENGSVAQTYMRLYTYYGTFRQGNAPLNQSIASDADSLIVRTVDSSLDVASGRFAGQVAVNKFGEAPNGAQTTDTDVWDRANASVTQQVWTAPLSNRHHLLSSTSVADTGGGAGARTVKIFGLPDWATAETSETLTMLGLASAQTVNKYVIIHRMNVLTTGTSGYNIGNILCTAGTDATVTAQINSQNGSTLMAIYGIPSTKNLFLSEWRASVNKIGGGSAVASTFKLKVNPEPNVQLAHFNVQGQQGLQSDGTSSMLWPFTTYLQISGPGIIKITAEASTNDTDVTAQFGGILLDA